MSMLCGYKSPDAVHYSNDRRPDSVPAALTMADGTMITTVRQWQLRRREILRLFSSEMYGTSPARPRKMTFRVLETDPHALDGKAIRKQILVLFNGNASGPKMTILLYLPAGMKKPVPVFLGLNFHGNHTVTADPGILLSDSWVPDREPGAEHNRATEKSRGTNASQWPVGLLLSKGYALATIYYGDIDPDYDDQFANGIHALYPDLQHKGDNFASVAAWAWGLQRAMDFLETDKQVDKNRVAVFGFSRLGKAALWAGASDERFAAVVSNESGKGGASLFTHQKGESIRRLNTVFPHWFCTNFKNYTDGERNLPFDQHWVVSLVAPRPVYIASAAEDLNSDPEGEFLSAKAAGAIYRLYGKEGIAAAGFPPVNQPVEGVISYHVRSGKHDVTEYDWQQYVRFADRTMTAGKFPTSKTSPTHKAE